MDPCLDFGTQNTSVLECHCGTLFLKSAAVKLILCQQGEIIRGVFWGLMVKWLECLAHHPTLGWGRTQLLLGRWPYLGIFQTPNLETEARCWNIFGLNKNYKNLKT